MSDLAADTVAAAPSCNDGMKNGKETDIDCGGSCPTCGPMKGCTGALDCASDVCGMDNKCALPSCTDKVLNGSETGVDCGGSCPACPMEATWGTNAVTWRGMLGKQISLHCPGMGTMSAIMAPTRTSTTRPSAPPPCTPASSLTPAAT